MNDLQRLSEDLDNAAKRIGPEAVKVVSKGALNIKNDVRKTWRRLDTGPPGGHAKDLWRAVDYDVYIDGDVIIAEVGPNLDKPQGALGGLIEYGDGDNAPIPALGPAWVEESPRLEDALGDLGERLLDG